MSAVNRITETGLWVISSVMSAVRAVIDKVANFATSFFAKRQNAPPAEVDLQGLEERVRAAQEEAEEFGRQVADRAQSINRQAAQLRESLPSRAPARPSPPKVQQPKVPVKRPEDDIEKQRVDIRIKLEDIEKALKSLRQVPEKESSKDKETRKQHIKLYETEEETLRSLDEMMKGMEKNLQEGRELLVAEAAVGQTAKQYAERSEARMQRLAKEMTGF